MTSLQTTLLVKIASQFILPAPVKDVIPLGEGFINDTFIVYLKHNPTRYILQRKNKNIFRDIPGMMQNIEKVTAHIKTKVANNGGNPEREAMTIIKTNDGHLYFQDKSGDFWAMALYIEDHIQHEVADTPEKAEAGGKGVGKFQSMLSDFREPLVDTLPGFHNMKFRYGQWDEALKKNPVGRKNEVQKEIEWVESRRNEMLEFWKLIENGSIPKRITHNDTKLSNILFDKSGDVLCVIDLDTVLNSTILNDFGDAIRSYANTGLEDDPNLNKVKMDLKIFEAFARGYLSEVHSFISETEFVHLPFSARFITFEQVLRFLIDYIDGDNYYKIKSPKHNLVRTRAQYQLLLSIENQIPQMSAIINKLGLEYNIPYRIQA